MKLQVWLDQMQEPLNILNARRQDHKNVIGTAADPEIMSAFEREFNLEQSPQLVAFYRLCGGFGVGPLHCLQLDDVGPGYYLWTAELLLRTKGSGPLMIKGEHAGNIIPIGHNGHEDDIAVRTDGRSEVLLLPESRVKDAVYWEDDPVIVIASDFDGFLERLLAETQATLRGDNDWKYMTSWKD